MSESQGDLEQAQLPTVQASQETANNIPTQGEDENTQEQEAEGMTKNMASAPGKVQEEGDGQAHERGFEEVGANGDRLAQQKQDGESKEQGDRNVRGERGGYVQEKVEGEVGEERDGHGRAQGDEQAQQKGDGEVGEEGDREVGLRDGYAQEKGDEEAGEPDDGLALEEQAQGAAQSISHLLGEAKEQGNGYAQEKEDEDVQQQPVEGAAEGTSEGVSQEASEEVSAITLPHREQMREQEPSAESRDAGINQHMEETTAEVRGNDRDRQTINEVLSKVELQGVSEQDVPVETRQRHVQLDSGKEDNDGFQGKHDADVDLDILGARTVSKKLSRTGAEKSSAVRDMSTSSHRDLQSSKKRAISDAKELLAYGVHVMEKVSQLGSGHPQSSVFVISFAKACNVAARSCMREGALKIADQLLKEALHFIRQSHSMSVFQESQQTLAETFNNLGCLLNSKGEMQESLKYLRQAADIEMKMEYEPSHAATVINICTTLSNLQLHEEALECAKEAVDMLCHDEDWESQVSIAGSLAGDLIPIAFNNLGLEFEYAGDQESAVQAYDSAALLAVRRWGPDDPRTSQIQQSAWDAKSGVKLGRSQVVKKPPKPPKTIRELRKLVPKKRLTLLRESTRLAPGISRYLETTSPVFRSVEFAPGFHSPRFWAMKDGMVPRRQSPFSKDARQIFLEMSRKSGADNFPSFVQKTSWGEHRLNWEDIPVADLSRLDGSVMSRSRVFSSALSNDSLAAYSKLQESRRARESKFRATSSTFQRGQLLRSQWTETAVKSSYSGTFPSLRSP